MSQLRVERLQKNYGAVTALVGISFEVETGLRLAIIGPNGAGKSTLFNCIAGEYPPSSGRIYFNGRDVTTLPIHERANLGLGHTFQRNNLFLGLSALENVRLAVQHRRKAASRLWTPVSRLKAVNDGSQSLLERIGLGSVRDQRVGALAYGQQRSLEVALALATEPQLLLLDEPTAGMSPGETNEMVRLIESLPRSLTILIVEHDMDVVFAIAERIMVLHYGQMIADGMPTEVKQNPRVIEAYLGA